MTVWKKFETEVQKFAYTWAWTGAAEGGGGGGGGARGGVAPPNMTLGGGRAPPPPPIIVIHLNMKSFSGVVQVM